MFNLVLALAAATTMARAAPRTASSQAIPDKPAAPVVTDSTTAVDPVGTYVAYITVQGNPMMTTTRIDKNADGTYRGTLVAEGIPPLPVNQVVVTGNKIHLSITAPDGGEAIIDMWVTGNDVAGCWCIAGDG